MTRRDFELIAETIRNSAGRFRSNRQHAMFANDTADMLGKTNQRFDAKRFIMACMPRHMDGSALANVWERTARGD